MLTDAQKADARRWMGYATLNDGESDYVWSSLSPFGQVALSAKLDALNATDQTVLVDTYLTTLAAMEAAIPAAAANLDTLIAGPWTANPREMSQRSALFNKWRRAMCGFLGFAPGPALGAGGITLVRA